MSGAYDNEREFWIQRGHEEAYRELRAEELLLELRREGQQAFELERMHRGEFIGHALLLAVFLLGYISVFSWNRPLTDMVFFFIGPVLVWRAARWADERMAYNRIIEKEIAMTQRKQASSES